MNPVDRRPLPARGSDRSSPAPVASVCAADSDAERTATLILELRRGMRRAGVRAGHAGAGTGAAGGVDAGATSTPGGSTREHTPAQMEVLRYLGSHPGAGTNAIAGALRLSPNTVSSLCSVLVREGAIRRERDPRDGRAAQFFLHSDLEASRGEKFDRRAEVVDAALGMLDDEQRASIRAALPALAQLVECLDSIATAPPGDA